METVDFSNVTKDNWKSRGNDAILHAKSINGKNTIWNGNEELEAIRSYWNTAINKTLDYNVQISGNYKFYVALLDKIQKAYNEASIAITGRPLHCQNDNPKQETASDVA